MTDTTALLERYFPRLAEEFTLKPFQKTVIEQVVNKKNTLCIMPTGGGKSLIYWLSGLALDGITIVISPLIALIDEQAGKLEEQGYEVLTIHAGTDAGKQAVQLTKLYNRELNPRFIFVSPERISTDGFFEYVLKARQKDIKLIAIDEVHCVSQWGFNFRPFYKRIPVFLDGLFGTNWPTILGLTATLNSKEIVDICEQFRIEKENILKNELLVRAELELKVLKFLNEDEKEEKFWELLNIHKQEKTLVYLYRKYNKRGAEEFAAEAIEKGYKAAYFHGDMSAADRQKIIQDYKNNELQVIFATNAFGMGIDIPDIRVVIHFMLPESVEQYYQEVGRAARDKKPANAYLLYSGKNIQVKKTHFIDRSFPSIDKLQEVFEKMTSYETGLKTLKYFDDDDAQKCLAYFLDNGILSIAAKGFTNLNNLSKITDNELQQLYDSTKTRNTITTLKKTAMKPDAFARKVYDCVVAGKVKLAKPFDKCLIIDSHTSELTDHHIKTLEKDIQEKGAYKHKLLDYFTYLLDGYEGSRYLHQEIGRYLGVDKFQLGKIYSTVKGDLVRSKSEVIIANLLHEAKIPYVYEKPLEYGIGEKMSPDFTININGEDVYWEHLGMIGTESYDQRWTEKMQIYETYFPGKLMITYEGAALSNAVVEMVNELKSR